MNGPLQQQGLAGAGPRTGQQNSLWMAVGFLLLAILVLTIPFTTYVVDLAMALVLLAVPLSYGVLRAKTGKFDYFEIFYTVSLLFFLYFGFSALYLKQNVTALQYRSLIYWLTPALGLALVGYLVMFTGYMTLGRRTRPSSFGNLVPAGILFYVLIGGIGFAGQLASAAHQRSYFTSGRFSGLISAGQQLSPLFFFVWFLVWYMFWCGKLGTTLRNLLFSLFIPAAVIVMYLHIGRKELAIVTIAMPAIAFWYARRKMPWKTVLAVVLVGVFVIFPLYNTFRLQDERMTTVSRLDQSLNQATRWNEHLFMDRSMHAFFERMGIITSVAAVLQNVPDHVDYRYGDTLLLAPIGLFVPRILWPGKPIIGLGKEFGRTFNLVNYIDTNTKIAPSLIGEFYWNFGLPGVVIGMFLVGVSFRFVYEKFGASAGFDPIGKAIYLLLFMRLIHFESSFAGIFGLVLKSYVVLHVLIVISHKTGLLGEMIDPADVREAA